MKFSQLCNEIERQIIVCLVEDCLAAGCEIRIYDGEEFNGDWTKDEDTVFSRMASTDEDRLFFRLPNGKEGWVLLIYGNGADVISDNTVPNNRYPEFDKESLSWSFMKRAEALAERFRDC